MLFDRLFTLINCCCSVTDYVVKQADDEDKEVFQEQVRHRALLTLLIFGQSDLIVSDIFLLLLWATWFEL